MTLGLYELVGATIEMPTPFVMAIDRTVYKHKWKVVKAYPNLIECERTLDNGNTIRECFNVGELVTEGILKRG